MLADSRTIATPLVLTVNRGCKDLVYQTQGVVSNDFALVGRTRLEGRRRFTCVPR